MKKGKTNKKKSPSRERYEQNHPTRSFRTSKELDDRIEAIKKAENMSLTDIVKVAVGHIEVKVRPIDEAWQEGYNEGEERGINGAVEIYAVPYNCVICGGEIVVSTDEEKRAIKRYMHEHGWGHGECHDRRR